MEESVFGSRIRLPVYKDRLTGTTRAGQPGYCACKRYHIINVIFQNVTALDNMVPSTEQFSEPIRRNFGSNVVLKTAI